MSKNYRKTPEKSESAAEFIFIQIDISKSAFVVPSKHTKDCPRHAAKYRTDRLRRERRPRSAVCRLPHWLFAPLLRITDQTVPSVHSTEKRAYLFHPSSFATDAHCAELPP